MRELERVELVLIRGLNRNDALKVADWRCRLLFFDWILDAYFSPYHGRALVDESALSVNVESGFFLVVTPLCLVEKANEQKPVSDWVELVHYSVDL